MLIPPIIQESWYSASQLKSLMHDLGRYATQDLKIGIVAPDDLEGALNYGLIDKSDIAFFTNLNSELGARGLSYLLALDELKTSFIFSYEQKIRRENEVHKIFEWMANSALPQDDRLKICVQNMNLVELRMKNNDYASIISAFVCRNHSMNKYSPDIIIAEFPVARALYVLYTGRNETRFRPI